jgi:hypothetical protein
VSGSSAPPTSSADAVAERRGRWLLAIARPLQVLAVLGVVVGAASLRVIVAGEREIAASTEALLAGDAREAAVRARRAAGWYAPGAPHVRVAYVRLTALAVRAEGLGDRELALLAWRGVRTAAIETRWLVTPHAHDLARADEAIARLSAAVPRPPGTRTDLPADVERRQLEALTREVSPRTGWVLVLLAGFVGWVGGASWVARRALAPSGRLALRRAAPGLAVTALGVAMWLLALWRA